MNLLQPDFGTLAFALSAVTSVCAVGGFAWLVVRNLRSTRRRADDAHRAQTDQAAIDSLESENARLEREVAHLSEKQQFAARLLEHRTVDQEDQRPVGVPQAKGGPDRS